MALKSNVPKVKAAISQEMDKLVLRVAHQIRNHAIESIQRGQKTGREYKIRSVTHTASAPGEAPANMTGNLVRSIRVEHFPGSGTARVAVAASYARELEFGTKKIAPRPFLRPSIAKVKAEMPDLIKGVSIKVDKK